MNTEFFKNQSTQQTDFYIELIKRTASLSNLFADSEIPYLHYRTMENIFCKAFNAENLSRGDVSIDAKKGSTGIGLKTFLHNNGNTFQKVAEFNQVSYLLKNLDTMDLVRKVSAMRNERISSTMRMSCCSKVIYHLITRKEKYFGIYEEDMDLISIDDIQIQKQGNNNIYFTDGKHEYNFNISKSTLLKRFTTEEHNKVFGFNVEILSDPFTFLMSSPQLVNTSSNNKDDDSEIEDFIVLPLYSAKSGNVEKSSGLNQWNASGRKRHHDEVYIPIPSWIHKVKPTFFTYNTEDHKTDSFDVSLPNGEKMPVRVAQAGGKALMSNPNSELGKWILRDILQIKPGTLITRKDLDVIGIDSVKLSKDKKGNYYLDFLKTGSYQNFEFEFNNKVKNSNISQVDKSIGSELEQDD